MECTSLSREGAGLAKPPKHLWRQPRTHIRIKQRFHSDTERYLYRNRTLEKLRPGLKKPRMSWPSSQKRYVFTLSLIVCILINLVNFLSLHDVWTRQLPMLTCCLFRSKFDLHSTPHLNPSIHFRNHLFSQPISIPMLDYPSV